jgi:hypothetical protein
MTAPHLQHAVPFASEVSRLAGQYEPALLLDRSGVILFVNAAWERFACANGGGDRVMSRGLVGTRWFDQIAGEEPRRHHRALLERAAGGPDAPGGHAAVQLNESNTPELARLVATRLAPVGGPGGEVAYLSIVHRLVRQRPLADVYPPVEAPAERWRGEQGIVQCSCCRRVARPEEPEAWDLSIELLARPVAGVRFDYCPLCLDLHDPRGAGDPRARLH